MWKESIKEKHSKYLYDALENQEVLVGKCIRIIETDLKTEALLIDVYGHQAILHQSEIDCEMEWRDLDYFESKEIPVVITNITDNMIYCSRKKAQKILRNPMINKLKSGEEFEGRITHILPYGAYVEVDEIISGYMSNKDFSTTHTRVKDVLQKDDIIKVKLKKYTDNDKLFLEPVQKHSYIDYEFIDKMNVGDIVEGTIRTVEPTRCFVTIIPGLDVLCSTPPREYLVKGEKVKILIKKIFPQDRKMRGKIITNPDKVNEKQDSTQIISRGESTKEVLDIAEDNNIEYQNLQINYSLPFVIPEGYKQVFSNDIKVKNINKIVIAQMRQINRLTDRDLDIAEFLLDVRFATVNQIYRNLRVNSNYANFKRRLDNLVSHRILNKFTLQGNSEDIEQIYVYCLDIGGKYLLEMSENPKIVDWHILNTNKRSHVIGKTLACTELYTKIRENFEDSKISFQSSPKFGVLGGQFVECRFSIGIQQEEIQTSLIGEVFRKTDFPYNFKSKMSKLEILLESDAWKKYFEVKNGAPTIVIIADDEQTLLTIEKEICNYKHISKNYILTTDERLNNNTLETTFVRSDKSKSISNIISILSKSNDKKQLIEVPLETVFK